MLRNIARARVRKNGKMTADAVSNEVLGVAMVGHNAGEVIHEAAMAMRFRTTLHDFIDMLHVFPTMGEALRIIAISRFKDPANLPAALYDLAQLTCCAA